MGKMLMMLAVQYLEPSPELAGLDPEMVRTKLADAFAILPIDAVLIGWHIPPKLLQVCAAEAAHAGATFYRWHPLLSGDGSLMPRPAWQTIGLNGKPVLGFQGMAEFTFLCPNRPAVHDQVLARVRTLAQSGLYEGLFFDRVRFPSPAGDPLQALACFCPDCRRVASEQGIDLDELQRRISSLATDAARAAQFVTGLLNPQTDRPPNVDVAALNTFLHFRMDSVSRFVGDAASVARAEGMTVGLDCFSPALAAMVGQDLAMLNGNCDWIKLMMYGHTLGPAGLPFELLGLADWLVNRLGIAEGRALALLAAATGLPLPPARRALRKQGLGPAALRNEVARGKHNGIERLLCGIELNDVAEVTDLNDIQIGEDLRAMRMGAPDGLVLSWDLLLMPLERLKLIQALWA